jgi:hypothetical protein
MVQPDCSGLIPSGPVSTYGVARPFAVNGFAGTTMSQLTLAAVVVAVLVDDGSLALAEGLAPNAAGLAVVESLSETAMTIPRTRAIASGIARVTAMRAVRLRPARRQRLVAIQFASMSLPTLPVGYPKAVLWSPREFSEK